MILTDIDIQQRVNKKDLVIHPLNNENITGVGYDLSIGIIKPLNNFDEFYEDDRVIKIPSKGYCLIITEEFVWLSKRLAGTLHSKGTLAAKGLMTNATNVDPNFKGQMIMSVYNVSDAEIVISKDAKTFITLIIHTVSMPTQKLVGLEGTKNSTRVLLQMLNDIYTNDNIHSKHRKSVNELHSYMIQKNHELAPPFELMLTKAKNFINPFKIWKFRIITRKIKFSFSTGLGNALKWLGLLIAIYFLWGLIHQLIINKTLSNDDKRASALLVIAIISLLTNLFKRKSSEE